jgi:hypothetical protein
MAFTFQLSETKPQNNSQQGINNSTKCFFTKNQKNSMVLFGKHRAVLLSVSKAYYKMPSKATIVTLNTNQAKLKWPDIVQTKDNGLKQQLKKRKKRKSKMHHNR